MAVRGHIIAHQMQWFPILQLDWLCDKLLGIVIWRGSNTGFDQNRGLQELLLGNQDKTKGSYANKTAVHHSILFTVFNVAINSKFCMCCGCPSTASIWGRVCQVVTWADRETRLIKVLYYYQYFRYTNRQTHILLSGIYLHHYFAKKASIVFKI